MRINPLLNVCSCQKLVAFKSKIVNGNYYTDQEYIDANRFWGYSAEAIDWELITQYSFFQYCFTKAPKRRVARILACIKDLEIEQDKKKQEDLARKKAFEAEQLRLEIEKSRLENELKKRTFEQEEINDLKNYNLPEEQKDIILQKVIGPIKIADKNDDLFCDIPNGVLIQGNNPEKRRELSLIIIKEILGTNYPSNYIKLDKIDTDQKFIEFMNKQKSLAREKFQTKRERSILYIENFEDYAPDIDLTGYNANVSCYLKNYFIDCYKDGLLIIATTDNIEEIEKPFIVNKSRFGFVVKVPD